MTIPTLTTPRLRLRAHTAADFPATAEMWADPRVTQHISGNPSPPQDSWSRLLRYAGHWALLGYGYWALETHDGNFVGEVGFADYKRPVTPPLTAPEAGWVLAPAFHGQGLATEAMLAALSWADAQLGFDQTVAIFAPDHAASLRVAKKLGFGDPVTLPYNTEEVIRLTRARVA